MTSIFTPAPPGFVCDRKAPTPQRYCGGIAVLREERSDGTTRFHCSEHAVVARVIALWDSQRGWIPGGARVELAEALGVDPSEVRTSQQIRRDRLIESGECSSLVDGEGDWWVFYPDDVDTGAWRCISAPGITVNIYGLDKGAEFIIREFGIKEA